MKIGFDAKRYYHNNTGLGNYSRTLIGKLQHMFPENEYVLYDEKTLQRTFCLGSKASADGCDIFHGLSNELPLIFPHRTMTKYVVTVHDICWRTFPEMYHFIDRHLYDWKYGASVRKADKVVAISQSTKRDVMEAYGVPEHQIEVIYQPVQDYYYTPLPTEEVKAQIAQCEELPENFILYVGSINSRKNLLSIVKALALIPVDQRPFLVVVGNGREYRKEVENYISTHQLQNYVCIKSDIHNNKLLQALYAKATLFVYPSFYEGFGLPVVEAALQHTPVITSTVSSLPEAAGPDACFINPNDKDASAMMAETIIRLCSDTVFAETVASRMEAYARRMFSPTTLTEQMMNLYRRIIQEKDA